MTAQGDLVIYGCDESGKQVFSYTMQTQEKPQISDDPDAEGEYADHFMNDMDEL